ncbi:MAG: VanZ family protein [Bacteroidota bacterium]
MSQFHIKTLILTIAAWILAILVIPFFLPINFPEFKIGGIDIHSDYIVHVLLFVILVITLKAVGIKINKIWVFLLLLIAAVVAEVWQVYIPHRTYNLSDLISNVIGVVIGYGVGFVNDSRFKV